MVALGTLPLSELGLAGSIRKYLDLGKMEMQMQSEGKKKRKEREN